jgi:hypothetical protein
LRTRAQSGDYVETGHTAQQVVTHAPHIIECDLAAANHIITAEGGQPLEEAADGHLVLNSAGEVVY